MNILEKLKINGVPIYANEFAYGDRYKLYILEDDEDKRQALGLDYDIKSIDEIEETYNNSCDFKFISTWKLEPIVGQFEKAVFSWGDLDMLDTLKDIVLAVDEDNHNINSKSELLNSYIYFLSEYLNNGRDGLEKSLRKNIDNYDELIKFYDIKGV